MKTISKDLKISMEGYRLFLGIDFGISKISLITSNGQKKIIENLPESYKQLFIKGKYDFYESAFSEPEKRGAVQENIKKAIGKIIDEALLSVIDPPLLPCTSGAISISGGISPKGFKWLKGLIQEYIEIVEIVPSPLAIAYSISISTHSIIVDIGANTTDICRFYGAAPGNDDHIVLYKAGDFINRRLGYLLKEKFGKNFIDLSTINVCKEKYGTVSKARVKLKTKFTVNNKIYIYDIAGELTAACCSIVPEIIERINMLTDSYDPEFKNCMRKNIFLAGRGSLIGGLAGRIENELKKYQDASVKLISESAYASAIGSLSIARDHYNTDIRRKRDV